MNENAQLGAYRASPGEVRDRPAIRGIVDELVKRHPAYQRRSRAA